MKRLIAAELKKLGTTRTVYLFFVGVVVLAVVTVIDPERSAASFDRPFYEHSFVLFTSLLARVLIFVMGVRMITDEFRHGTIVPTLLAAPRRNRILAAKAISVAAVGAVMALLAWIAMTVAASFLASSLGTSLELGADAWRSLFGAVAAGAAWATIGLGVGAVVRNQVIAIVGGIVWMMGIEDGLKGWFGDLQGYLPGQAGLALAVAPSSGVVRLTLATMAAYAAILLVLSSITLKKDIS